MDLVDVSTGQTVPRQKPLYGRMWQTPFADNCATNSASPPWPWATSTSPTTSTRSSPPAARTCARSPDRTWLTPPGRCTPPPSRATRQQWWPPQYLSGKAQLERNLQRARAAGGAGMSERRQTQLAGRHAVVTGASRGIGASIAAALAAQGMLVSLLGRDAAALKERRRAVGRQRARRSDNGGCQRCGLRAGGLRHRARPLRPGRHPDQQRRPGREREVHRHRSRRCGTACWPSISPARTCARARRSPTCSRWLRAHRQHRQHRRTARRGLHLRLCRLQARGHRTHALAGAGIRHAQHHRERRMPRLRRHRYRQGPRSPTS